MYTPMFLDELFKPQEVYTAAATKQIFEKLAHSSIMRLNKTSMDKLYVLLLVIKGIMLLINIFRIEQVRFNDDGSKISDHYLQVSTAIFTDHLEPFGFCY